MVPGIVIAGRGRSITDRLLVDGSRAPAALTVAHPVLDSYADHVDDALQGVADDPGAERHRRVLVAAEHENHGRHGDEGQVPEQVERHDGAGVGPVRLPLLEVFRRRLPHQHRRLPHRPPPAAAQQPRRAAEGGPAERTASAPPPRARAAEQRRGGVKERVSAGARRARRRHRGEPLALGDQDEGSGPFFPRNGIGNLGRDTGDPFFSSDIGVMD
jgi:hypothetical protein